MVDGVVDAVATAHTLDDQAETVLQKILRGAWTEGLSGIHPVVTMDPGHLRPFLENNHAAIEEWLRSLPQPWREIDNQEFGPHPQSHPWAIVALVAHLHPQIAGQLARLATISADEEAYWQEELQRLLPGLLLPGRPTRGGGRSASTHPEEQTVAIEQVRLGKLHPAMARRVLRAAARSLGARLNFEHTEQMLTLAGSSRGGKFDLGGGITVERSPREIRLTRSSTLPEPGLTHEFLIPGEVVLPSTGFACAGSRQNAPNTLRVILRTWKAGDRVALRHSRGPRRLQRSSTGCT